MSAKKTRHQRRKEASRRSERGARHSRSLEKAKASRLVNKYLRRAPIAPVVSHCRRRARRTRASVAHPVMSCASSSSRVLAPRASSRGVTTSQCARHRLLTHHHLHHHPTRRNRRARVRSRGGDILAMATKETFASFDEMIAGSSVPVLVDFYATWCGPCQILSTQVFPAVAAAVGKDQVKLVKINTEKYPNVASTYGVEALPTIILFKDGKVADRIEGLPNAPQLIERLKYFLAAPAA